MSHFKFHSRIPQHFEYSHARRIDHCIQDEIKLQSGQPTIIQATKQTSAPKKKFANLVLK
jgi:hypothetical protein|tara:strand:+ start:28582 stop:28761 length:180 start_codon:yes stop_codon:yes gene_type:complete